MELVMPIKLKAPEGEFIVISVDLFSLECLEINNYDNPEIALGMADMHNDNFSGVLKEVYYVYDDLGQRLKTDEFEN